MICTPRYAKSACNESIWTPSRHLKSEVNVLKAKLEASKGAEVELKTQVDAVTEEVNRYKRETQKVIVKKDDEIDVLRN